MQPQEQPTPFPQPPEQPVAEQQPVVTPLPEVSVQPIAQPEPTQPMQPPQPVQQHRPLGKVDYDEKMVTEIRRHPFGLFLVVVQALLAVLAAVALIAFLLPSVLERGSSAYTGVALLTLGFIGLLALFLLVYTIIYRSNRVIVTNKNVTQILRAGIFNTKISQLSMADVQDVTSEQKGPFAQVFNFGTLKIETAGEQVNFNFIYCPNPAVIAKQILEAREKYLEESDHTGGA